MASSTTLIFSNIASARRAKSAPYAEAMRFGNVAASSAVASMAGPLVIRTSSPGPAIAGVT